MSSPSLLIYLCGWAAGILIFRWGVNRDWNNPDRRRDLSLLRYGIDSPQGIAVVAGLALFLWWYWLVAAPLDAWRDRRWTPDGGDGDD